MFRNVKNKIASSNNNEIASNNNGTLVSNNNKKMFLGPAILAVKNKIRKCIFNKLMSPEMVVKVDSYL